MKKSCMLGIFFPQQNTSLNSGTTSRHPMYKILNYLCLSYGCIDPNNLIQNENEVTNMAYDTITPINIISNTVEDLVEYIKMVNSP